MSTLAQMRSRIADDLNRDDLSSQIDKAINRAIEYYQHRRFWFNEKIGTFSTVASQESYGTSDNLPSDISKIDTVQVTQSSSKFLIDRIDYERMKALNTSSPTGLPAYYCFYAEKLFFYPIPDAIYTITLSYVQKYSALSADADTNDFTAYAEDLIEARARGWLYNRILQDYNAAGVAKTEEMDSLKGLQELTRSLTATNSVAPTQW